MKRYVAAGDRDYLVGVQGGRPCAEGQPESKWNRLAYYRANGRRTVLELFLGINPDAPQNLCRASPKCEREALFQLAARIPRVARGQA